MCLSLIYTRIESSQGFSFKLTLEEWPALHYLHEKICYCCDISEIKPVKPRPCKTELGLRSMHKKKKKPLLIFYFPHYSLVLQCLRLFFRAKVTTSEHLQMTWISELNIQKGFWNDISRSLFTD